jgi:hypothetical protein
MSLEARVVLAPETETTGWKWSRLFLENRASARLVVHYLPTVEMRNHCQDRRSVAKAVRVSNEEPRRMMSLQLATAGESYTHRID